MKTITVLIMFLMLSVVQVQATNQTFTWEVNSESNISYYNLYCGASPDTYDTPVNVGNVITYSMDITGDFYCRLTAVNSYGNESDMSNECSNTKPSPPTGFRCQQ